MSEPMPLAAVSVAFSDTLGLVDALRKLRELRNVSCELLDAICGLPRGYSQKVLADPPVKGIGPISTFPLIGGLGSAMVLVDDPEAMQRIATRMVARNKSQVRSGGKHAPIVLKLSRRQLRKLAKQGGLARARKLKPSALRRIARKAARARWRKVGCVAADSAAKAKAAGATVTPQQEPKIQG